MMQNMRRITKPIMWIIAVAFVGFLGWEGVFTSRTGGLAGVVAKINGEEISLQQYTAVDERSRAQAQQEFGDTVEFDDYMNQIIRQRTWEDIISQTLLHQEAQKRELVVTNNEIFEYLRRYPPVQFFERAGIMEYFITDGQFDYNKYVQALLTPQFNWAPIEAYVQEQLLIAKLQMTVAGLVRVSKPEVKEQWYRQNTLLNLLLVRIPAGRYENQVQVSESELQGFYEKNKNRFPREERASLQYVEFVKGPQEKDDEEARNKLADLKSKIKSDSDFVALAGQFSEDPATSSVGGDLGWIDKGGFIPEVEQALAGMQPGEISQPVKTSYGWHLIKLWEKKENSFRASHILIKPKAGEESMKALKSKAEEFARKAKTGSYEKLAGEYDRPVVFTGWFRKGEYIQGIGSNQQANDFAFSSQVGQTSGVIEIPTAFLVAQVKEYRQGGPADLAEIRAQLSRDLVREKALSQCLAKALEIYQLVQKGESLTKAAKSNNEALLETGLFLASDVTIPKIGENPRIAEAGFGLTSANKYSPPVRGIDGIYLLELKDRQAPPDTVFNAMSDSLHFEALSQKQSLIYNEWYNQLRQKAKIEDFRDQYFTDITATEGS